MCPISAEARVAVKATRFPLRLCSAPAAFGELVTAPLFRLALETGIEAIIGGGLTIDRKIS
jgi:hypothetical protein